MPDFEKLSFEEAIQLFRGWGFRVEQGPSISDITLIHEGATHRSYLICEPKQLAEMATSILQVRWRNGTMMDHAMTVQ
jgi:hypothetical protein